MYFKLLHNATLLYRLVQLFGRWSLNLPFIAEFITFADIKERDFQHRSIIHHIQFILPRPTCIQTINHNGLQGKKFAIILFLSLLLSHNNDRNMINTQQKNSSYDFLRFFHSVSIHVAS